MQFKAPKGDIFGWSIFWFVCGVIALVMGTIKGDIALIILSPIALAVVALIWLDQKWIGPPLVILYVLSAILRLVGLYFKGLTLLAVCKVILPLYFAYMIWEWSRREDDIVLEPHPGNRPDPFATSPFDKPRDDDRWSNPYQGNRRDGQ